MSDFPQEEPDPEMAADDEESAEGLVETKKTKETWCQCDKLVCHAHSKIFGKFWLIADFLVTKNFH